jgi:hypothetical protein
MGDSLPKGLTWPQASTQWPSLLDPVIQSPMGQVRIISGINLVSGVNIINHKLGRLQQGWFVADINAGITLYRSAPFNSLTLSLTASAPAIVHLGVF